MDVDEIFNEIVSEAEISTDPLDGEAVTEEVVTDIDEPFVEGKLGDYLKTKSTERKIIKKANVAKRNERKARALAEKLDKVSRAYDACEDPKKKARLEIQFKQLDAELTKLEVKTKDAKEEMSEIMIPYVQNEKINTTMGQVVQMAGQTATSQKNTDEKLPEGPKPGDAKKADKEDKMGETPDNDDEMEESAFASLYEQKFFAPASEEEEFQNLSVEESDVPADYEFDGELLAEGEDLFADDFEELMTEALNPMAQGVMLAATGGAVFNIATLATLAATVTLVPWRGLEFVSSAVRRAHYKKILNKFYDLMIDKGGKYPRFNKLAKQKYYTDMAGDKVSKAKGLAKRFGLGHHVSTVMYTHKGAPVCAAYIDKMSNAAAPLAAILVPGHADTTQEYYRRLKVKVMGPYKKYDYYYAACAAIDVGVVTSSMGKIIKTIKNAVKKHQHEIDAYMKAHPNLKVESYQEDLNNLMVSFLEDANSKPEFIELVEESYVFGEITEQQYKDIITEADAIEKENALAGMLPQSPVQEPVLTKEDELSEDVEEEDTDIEIGDIPDDVLEYVMDPELGYTLYVENGFTDFVKKIKTKFGLSRKTKKLVSQKAALKAKLRVARKNKAKPAKITELKKDLIAKEREVREIQKGAPKETIQAINKLTREMDKRMEQHEKRYIKELKRKGFFESAFESSDETIMMDDVDKYFESGDNYITEYMSGMSHNQMMLNQHMYNAQMTNQMALQSHQQFMHQMQRNASANQIRGGNTSVQYDHDMEKYYRLGFLKTYKKKNPTIPDRKKLTKKKITVLPVVTTKEKRAKKPFSKFIQKSKNKVYVEQYFKNGKPFIAFAYKPKSEKTKLSYKSGKISDVKIKDQYELCINCIDPIAKKHKEFYTIMLAYGKYTPLPAQLSKYLHNWLEKNKDTKKKKKLFAKESYADDIQIFKDQQEHYQKFYEQAMTDNNLELIDRYKNKLQYATNRLFALEEAEEINIYPVVDGEIVTEVANIDREIRDEIKMLNQKGYKTKYSSAGHTRLRKKEDGKRDGVYQGKLYSDARIMFNGNYNFLKAPKYWMFTVVDGNSYLDIIPLRYNEKDGSPSEAFGKWKANYMGTLHTWVENLPNEDSTRGKVMAKDTKGRVQTLESVNELYSDMMDDLLLEADIMNL